VEEQTEGDLSRSETNKFIQLKSWGLAKRCVRREETKF